MSFEKLILSSNDRLLNEKTSNFTVFLNSPIYNPKSMNIIRNVFVKLGLEKRKINEYNLDVWQTEVSIPPEEYNNNGTKSSIISSPDRIFLNTPPGTFENLVIPN